MRQYNKVYLEITNRCNLHCSFCPGTRRPPRTMSPTEFRLLAEKLRPATRYLYLHLMGEPLLHPELPEYLGSCISFAKRAAAAGKLTGLRLWNLDGSLSGQNDLNAPMLEELRRAFPGEWPPVREGHKIAERTYLEFGERFEWPDLSAGEREGDAFCYGLRDQFGVLCDGTVVPCCLDHEGDLALGNLFTQPLEEILSSPRARAIYESFSGRQAREELCRKCGYARRFIR